MVKIDLVRASNASIKSTFSSPTALFVGATSGIGESTLKHFAKNAEKPTIYLVGRSEVAGARIIEECKQLNSEGKYEFMKADVSLMANVDTVCAEVRNKVEKVDFLVMSPGYLTFDGRTGILPSPVVFDVHGVADPLNLHRNERRS